MTVIRIKVGILHSLTPDNLIGTFVAEKLVPYTFSHNEKQASRSPQTLRYIKPFLDRRPRRCQSLFLITLLSLSTRVVVISAVCYRAF
jgi:hypothetical protein